MSFLIGMIGGVVGILIVIFIIAMYINNKIKSIINPYNIVDITNNFNGLKDVIDDMQNEKSISGLTKLLEPRILEDFPDFNKELIFSKIESNLMKIFSILENKEIYNDFDIQLLMPHLTERIQDMKHQEINVSYDNTIFHKHAIKSYEKKDGIATLVLSSSLEYEYNKTVNGVYENNDYINNIKKQTRYITTFIYVYDIYKIKKDQPFFIINCPNCGAPLKYLENMQCEYCKSNISELNLKSWLMVSYKEE